MYETKEEYKGHRGRYEINYHVPEWIRILKDYFTKDYSENHSGKPSQQKKKKKSVEGLL